MRRSVWRPWQRRVQKTIFALLLLDTCLLAAAVAPPFFGWPALFGNQAAPLLDMEIPVQQDAGLLFGNLRLETEGGLSLALATLAINGVNAGNFGAGSIIVRVYEGDVLTIDGDAYKRSLQFYISAVSSNIDSSLLPQSVTTDGDITKLPAISFK